MNKKQKKLLELMGTIQRECFKRKMGLNGTWFFPEHNGVKGFLGTDKIVFVGMNPSCGRFPSRAVEFFYDCLKKHKLENVHLTDVIKSRLSNRDYARLKNDNAMLDINIDWLKEEIFILDRNYRVRIVALGKDTYKLLRDRIGNIVNDIYCLPHYAWVDRYSKARKSNRRKFVKKLEEILEQIDSL
jgi:hypothetical protein